MTWPELLKAYAILLAVIAVVVFVGVVVVVDIFDGDSSGSERRIGDVCVDDFAIGADGGWYGSTHECIDTADRYSEPPVRLSKGDRY